MTFSQAVTRKAVRLQAQGRVHEHAVPRRVFTIVGDSGTHTVLVYAPDRVTCTCPARSYCSHIAAALLESRDQQAAA